MPSLAIDRRALLLTGASALSFSCSARPDAQNEHPNTPAESKLSSVDSWHVGPALPFAAQEIYPTLHAGHIHLAGGFIADTVRISGVTDRHIALNPATGIWNELPALPTPRHHPNLVSFSGTLLSLGGFEVADETATWIMQPGVWIFDGDRWRDGPSLPQPNGESVCAVIGEHLHVCSGRKPQAASNAGWNDHIDTADHFILTGLESDWNVAAPLPTARNSAASTMIDGRWHVVGGRTVNGGNSAAHEIYEASEDRWRTAAPMPQAQGGLACASVNGQLYAFGGEYFDNGGGVYPESWRYDPASDAWSAISDMPHPRHGLGAVTVENAIYVIGGALEASGNRTSALVEIYTP